MEPTSAAFSPLLSVIVPVAPEEDQWPGLVGLVGALPEGSEVLFTGPEAPWERNQAGTAAWESLRQVCGPARRVAWIASPLGRARQLNVAAKVATGRYLWFVHADSRIGEAGVAALARTCAAGRDALLWFDLEFAPESARLDPLMSVTARAVAFRSRVLRLPFGDQALCLPRSRFFECGAFDETAPYGEDHLLVWKARQRGLPLEPVGAAVTTSARRYRDRGWGRTTLKHVALTVKQGAPEAWRLLTRERQKSEARIFAPAVFVKTPGYSQLKTRLARTIGDERATEFHRLSARAVASVLKGSAGIEPHWAVAEREALGEWPDFPNVSQGEGELGSRLDHVYEAMRRGGERVAVLLGADAPQLAASVFSQVTAALDGGATFVLGPATDGGFYLFAGSALVPRALWARVPYSSPDTAAALVRELERMGDGVRVAQLEALTDVDTKDDLGPVARALASLSAPTDAQRALLLWLQEV